MTGFETISAKIGALAEIESKFRRTTSKLSILHCVLMCAFSLLLSSVEYCGCSKSELLHQPGRDPVGCAHGQARDVAKEGTRSS